MSKTFSLFLLRTAQSFVKVCKGVYFLLFFISRGVGRKILSPWGLNILGIGFLLVIFSHVSATAPSPGHPWANVGDGFWASSGTTAYHTFGFPDVDADVLTDYNLVQGDLLYGSAASATARLPKDTNATRYLSNKGASNNPQWSTITLTNGVDGILGSANGGTGNASTTFTGQTIGRTYTLPDANTAILTDASDVTLAQGGTGATLSASNGGIAYTISGVFAILSGVAAAGRLLLSGNVSAPIWSNASYPTTVSASGSPLVSTGADVVSQDQSIPTVVTGSGFGTIGTFVASTTNSLTVFRVGMFNIPKPINVNTLSISPTTVTTAGTVKICIYNEAGGKVIDTTATGATSNTTLSTTTPSTIQLKPGNYYAAIGCATTCNILFNYWRSTVGSPLTTLTPTGKKVYEGRVTMTSGTCNTTLPAITAAASSTPVLRLDN